MPIKVLVHIVTSRRDINGNCYHFGIFTNPAKGRHARLSIELGGKSNAIDIAYRIAGNDYEGVYETNETLGKREWSGKRSTCSVSGYEGSVATCQALAELFDVKPSIFARN